ncbi:hypothetical protein [Arthrobacter glacialis]|uniref:Uncharacterized protein n=1 Tax=Arthrobacter glacialis TaxID=1664 RepID=A0A2S3ZWM0_ARTGL|nr:hypothetical protein [Arthrobacter glacialis]POH73464.1 hypothetical protein CVS27_11190 [Arthrobacter glacialis]
MTRKTIFVSVNDSYALGGSMTQLAWAAHAGWPRTFASCEDVQVLVAVKDKMSIGAWSVIGVYLSKETYTTPGGDRPRIAFALGESVPLDPTLHNVPSEFRRGCVIAER